jgi:hypothetical protein
VSKTFRAPLAVHISCTHQHNMSVPIYASYPAVNCPINFMYLSPNIKISLDRRAAILLIWAVAAPGLGRFATSLAESGVGRGCNISGRIRDSLQGSKVGRFATSLAGSRFGKFVNICGTIRNTKVCHICGRIRGGQVCHIFGTVRDRHVCNIFGRSGVCRSVQNNADPLIVAQLYSKILFEKFWARLA